VLGLALGKPIGIVAFAWRSVRARAAALPAGVRWSGVLVVGLVGGIGFTMALFIAALALPGGPLVDIAELGIFGASVVALLGLGAGRFLLPNTMDPLRRRQRNRQRIIRIDGNSITRRDGSWPMTLMRQHVAAGARSVHVLHLS
jgi:hypothetical protein